MSHGVRSTRAIALILALAGCGAEPVDAPPTGGADTTAPFDLPQTPPGFQLAWLLREMNGDGFDVSEVEAHFNDTVLRNLPAARMQAALQELRVMMAPVTVAGVHGTPEPTRVVGIVVTRDGAYFTFKITTDADDAIAGIFYEAAPHLAPPPAPPPRPAAFDWPMLIGELDDVAPRHHLLAAELTATGCSTIATAAADVSAPVGSAFKLFVLQTLIQEVEAGTHKWIDSLAIEDENKSLPSGTYHRRNAGETEDLATFARQMIEHSDNTATDHLIDLLGRASIEANLPQGALPLLTTREFFLLKLGVTDVERGRYVTGNVADKRAFLETELAGRNVFALDASGWSSPRYIDEVEWFLTPNALCGSVHAIWRHMSNAAEPVGTMLSANPGYRGDRSAWRYFGFKGGSEPGVLELVWLLERHDGRWFALVMGFADGSRPVSSARALEKAGLALGLLADQ